MEVFGTQLLAGLGDLVQWESVVMHLIALIILTVGLYFLLFKPVKRMVKERQDKIRKIEKENTDLNEEVRQMKSSTEAVLSDAKKEAAVIHENAVKVANQKADDIVSSARREAKSLIERTEQEMEEDLRTAADPQKWLDAMRGRLSRRTPPDNDNNTAAAVWLDL